MIPSDQLTYPRVVELTRPQDLRPIPCHPAPVLQAFPQPPDGALHGLREPGRLPQYDGLHVQIYRDAELGSMKSHCTSGRVRSDGEQDGPESYGAPDTDAQRRRASPVRPIRAGYRPPLSQFPKKRLEEVGGVDSQIFPMPCHPILRRPRSKSELDRERFRTVLL